MPAMDRLEEEKLLKEIHQGWEETKTATANIQSEVKKYGTALGEHVEKWTKANDRIDAAEVKLETRFNEFKTELGRIALVEQKLEDIRQDLSRRGGPITENDPKALVAQKKEAFFKAMRYEAAIGKSSSSNQKSLSEVLGPELFKALIVGNDEAGGYLAPGEFVAEMLVNVVEWSPIRSIARIRSTTKPTVRMPKRKTTAAASWVAETGTRTQTQNPAFGVEEIAAHEMYAMVQVSFQEMEDAAFDIEGFLRDEFAEQFGVSEGTAFVSGDGAGKPKGFAVDSNVGFVHSGDATGITADQVIALSYEPKDAYIQRATWVLNRASLRVIRQMKAGDGHFLWAPGIAMQARPSTILDRPYITSPDMASPTSSNVTTYTAGAFPIAFGDFNRGYMVLDRLDIQFMTDPYTAKANGMMEISARKRVGGQVIIPEAIKLLKVAA